MRLNTLAAVILVVIPSLLLAAASTAAFAGRWVWWLDVLANFRAQFLVALTVLGLVLLATRFKIAAYVTLGAAALNLVVVAPLYLGGPADSEPGVPVLRVVSFNLLSTNDEFNEVLDYIEAIDADLVFLHEASRPWEVAVESAGLDYEVIRPRSDELIFGTLVLARDEVDAVSFGFAAAQARAVGLVYRPRGWPEPIEVLATHPLAPTSQERADLRDAQIGFAANWSAERSGPRIVVGDLNATPWSAPFRVLEGEGNLRNSQIGFGLQPSFPATSNPLLRVPIDHLLHSEQLTVVDRQLGPSMGSDHFVLVVDLSLVAE